MITTPTNKKPATLQPFLVTVTNPETGDVNTATVHASTRTEALTRTVLNGPVGFCTYKWRNIKISGANHV